MPPQIVAAATFPILVRQFLAVTVDPVDFALRHADEAPQALLEVVVVTTSPRLIRRRLAALVDPVDIVVLIALVLVADLLDDLWGELGSPRVNSQPMIRTCCSRVLK